MKDDLQIKIAASLVDTDAPERLSSKRAGEFVSKMLQQKKKTYKTANKTIPFLVWGGTVTIVAASITLGVFVFRPNTSQNYGTPSQLMEMQSVHSNTAAADTTALEQTDTVLVYELVEEK